MFTRLKMSSDNKKHQFSFFKLVFIYAYVIPIIIPFDLKKIFTVISSHDHDRKKNLPP